jgi:hypothetical protein
VRWREGDGWQDFSPMLAGDESLTVISATGSARCFQPGGRGLLQCRVPLEGAQPVVADGTWWPVDVAHGSPCGLCLDEFGGMWAKGTPVRAVLAGVHPRWMDLPDLRDVADRAVRSVRLPVPSGHPPEPCGALFCSQLRVGTGGYDWWCRKG